MKILRLALVGFLLVGMAACATTGRQTIKEVGARVYFSLPQGWVVQKFPRNQPIEHDRILSPASATKGSDPAVTIDFAKGFDERFSSSEQGCAASYLKGIREVKDSAVQRTMTGSVDSPIYGKITQYRYASAYYGDHLVCFVVTQGGYATIELWAATAPQRAALTPGFRAVVRSISISR